MWTRLLSHSTLKEAFTPKKIHGKWIAPPISCRYKAMLRKEFLMANVPWPLEKTKKPNPRDKKPKGHKAEQLKIIRLERIKKSLATSDEAMLKYRQDRLNNRRLRSLDLMVSQVIPAWLKFDREEYEEKEREAEKARAGKRDSDEEDTGPKPKSKGSKIFAQKKEEQNEEE